MATSHSDSEVQRLAAHNQALSEELTQCQTDKEFVWSLWKRLQVANPDISQAISMVVQREKEKAELKDRKVLEILHSKDDRIAYLEQLVAEQERRLAEISERVGDASIDRREELAALHVHHEQQTSEAKQKEKLEGARIQSLLDEKDKALTELKAERDDLKHEVERLQATVEESQAALSKMQELNGQYEAKVQELQVGLEDVVQKARLASKELDSKTEGLERTKTRLQELTVELKSSGQDLHRTRLEYEDMKAQHDQAIHQAAQQAQLIQQLQALQADTHKVLKNQESAHTMESTNFQKMYHELRIRFEKLVHSEKELRLRLVESQGQVTAKPPMRSVSLQVNLKDNSGQRSRSWSRSREVTRVKHRIQERVSSESSPSSDQHAIRDRATSTPTKDTARRRARSVSPFSGHHVTYEEQDGVWNQGRISDFLDASQRRGGRDTRKKEDLRKLLRLKNREVEELRKAHGRRLERLRTLQSAYDVVTEQIKTYEQHESGKEKKKKRLSRSESKDLRREDSDGVWNELAYYKQQTSKLTQEMMNIEEEIDRLRVQAAVDASTIEDLTRCLEDEKNGLENQLARLQAANKREEREKARAEDLFDKNKRLEKSLHILQSKQSEWNDERDKLERHLRSMRADLVQAKTVSTHKEVEHHALVEEITKLKMKMKKLAVTMRREAERERQTSRAEDPIEDDLGPGVHVIVHEEEDDGDDDDSEADGDDDWDNEEDPDFYHSTPRKTSTRRSQSLSPGRTLSGSGPNARGRSRTSSLHSTKLDGSNRTRSRNSNRSRSLGAISGSPSKRELMSVLHHLDRMAQAYQDSPPVFQTLLMSVATQTERVAMAESAMMTESEGSESDTSLSTEGAIFPGIHPISPITSRRDIATSPIKNLSFSSHTISKKAGTKSRGSSPGPGGVHILKRRLGALQQQVASLQEQRKMLQKAAVEYKQSNEALQADLNLANARQQNSKITIQRLTHEVEDLKKEKDLLQTENQDLIKQKMDRHSDAEWKSSEARLKSQASEIVRQGSIIKAMKSEKEVLNETIKTLENKVHHLDRDLSQKRTLIDDLRSRTRSAITSDKAHAETVDMLENKILSLTETLDKRKVEIDSLRKRVAVVTKEKHHYEQLTFDLRNELDKKAAVLKDTLAKLSEADSALTEMETTASQQLQMLASQSETALDAAHTKIKQMQSRIRDLEAFIEDLAKEISSQTQTALDQALTRNSRTTTPGPDPEKDQSMIRAQSIASSILNMSTKDLEQFMEDEKEEDQTQPVKQLASHDQDGAWQQQIKALLRSKKFSSKKLKDLMMEKLHTRDEALALARESR